MWLEEATLEKNYFFRVSRKIRKILGADDKDYAIYPKSIYEAASEMSKVKQTNYCFIGALKIDPITESNRAWVIQFAKKNFDQNSYLQFTDSKTRETHQPLGEFDHTLTTQGFVPKEVSVKERNYFDRQYFAQLCQSKFTLCPAGDSPWSMRFYEAIMCKSIPIVNQAADRYRSIAESRLDYRFYQADEVIEYREDWVQHNYEIFMKYHTFQNRLS